MAINIDRLSLKELQELDGRIQKAIVVARDRERTEAKQKIEALALESGFSLSDLFGGGRGAGRGKAANGGSAPKYANPDNRAETWTGRGRKPNWLVAKLEDGASLDDFAI